MAESSHLLISRVRSSSANSLAWSAADEPDTTDAADDIETADVATDELDEVILSCVVGRQGLN